jgi:hypothetical protein
MKTTKPESNPDNQQKAGCEKRLVRRFRVRGVCFVPASIEMEIDATSEEEAVKYALATNWKSHIGGNDCDASSAFDWEPAAEEINPANELGWTPPQDV